MSQNILPVSRGVYTSTSCQVALHYGLMHGVVTVVSECVLIGHLLCEDLVSSSVLILQAPRGHDDDVASDSVLMMCTIRGHDDEVVSDDVLIVCTAMMT